MKKEKLILLKTFSCPFWLLYSIIVSSVWGVYSAFCVLEGTNTLPVIFEVTAFNICRGGVSVLRKASRLHIKNSRHLMHLHMYLVVENALVRMTT